MKDKNSVEIIVQQCYKKRYILASIIVVIVILIYGYRQYKNWNKIVYFDNNGTTRPYNEVNKLGYDLQEKYYGNPSQICEIGKQISEKIEGASKKICRVLKCETSKQIIYTSGATESNNIIIQGLYNKHSRTKQGCPRGRGAPLVSHFLRQQDVVITTKIEHPSVYQTINYLQTTNDIKYLKVKNDMQGFVDIEDLENLLEKHRPFLVSIIAASNITGVIQDVCKIGKLCKQYGAFFHVDGTQIVGKYKLDKCYFNYIDSMSFSAHKYGGPKGTGCLYIKDYNQTEFLPLTYGGGQQNQIRPGTENTVGIVCGARALEISEKKITQEYPKKILECKKKIIQQLQQIFKKKFILNGPKDYQDKNKCLYNTISCQIPILNQKLIPYLNKNNVCVSKSSACSKNSSSQTLDAIGISEKEQEYSIRISMSFCNDMQQVKKLIQVMKKANKKLSNEQ